jgi:hypothetical protein
MKGIKMRLITEKIATAFNQNKPLSIGNTTTDGNAIYLHGNKILERRGDGIYWNLCGWNTRTTRERLSPFVRICCKNGAPYVNGALIEHYNQFRKVN